MVVDVPGVKLKDQAVRAPLAGVKLGVPETLVLAPAVAAYAPEKALVLAARGLYVPAVDQRLSAHAPSLRREYASQLDRRWPPMKRQSAVAVQLRSTDDQLTTSSARSNTDRGIVRPRDFAAFRLTTSVNRVGC